MQSTFFYLGKFLKWWADDQSSSIPKGSIYCIKHMHIQPFSMEADWQEIWHQMDVSAMFYICRHCIFTWWGRYGRWAIKTIKSKWQNHHIFKNFPQNFFWNIYIQASPLTVLISSPAPLYCCKSCNIVSATDNVSFTFWYISFSNSVGCASDKESRIVGKQKLITVL